MNTETKGKQIEARLKIWLLQGQKITSNEALTMWRTNRLAEYIRRLRVQGMEIKTEMVSENGDTFGVYYMEKKPKIDRIATREYMNQA